MLTLSELTNFVKSQNSTNEEQPRSYLGCSGLGAECSRALWYQSRWAVDREFGFKGLAAIEDGHAQEKVMRERMKKAGFVFRENSDPLTFGEVIKGHVDGVIENGPPVEGLKSYPVIWEHKSCNEKKFKELEKKATLEAWDKVYFIQAQVYMLLSGLSQHLLSCSTPGGRDFQFVLTELDSSVADKYIRRGLEIWFSDEPPARAGHDESAFVCKWCDYHSICWGSEVERLNKNCRTCMYVTMGAKSYCSRLEENICGEVELLGCSSHLFNPGLVNDEQIDAEEKDGQLVSISYKRLGINRQGTGNVEA